LHQRFVWNEGEIETLKTERVDLIGLLKKYNLWYKTTETSVIYDDTCDLSKDFIRYN